MAIHSSWFKRLNLSSKKNLKNILLKSQKNLISTISFAILKKDLNNKNESIFNPISPLAQRQYILEATSPTKVVVSSTTSGGNGESHSMSMMMKGGLSQSLKLTPKPLTSISLNKVISKVF